MIHIRRIYRFILKRSGLWALITVIPKWMGVPIHTVQMLVIDRRNTKMLLLETHEVRQGVTVPQGACSYGNLVRADWAKLNAIRECEEEAVENTIDPKQVSNEQIVYAEGVFKQFCCHVFILEVKLEQLKLKETGEGKACWYDIEQAMKRLDNPVLTHIIQRAFDIRH